MFKSMLRVFSVVISISFAAAVSRTSPPSGALVVRQSGTQAGEYSTVSAAVTALGTSTANRTIFIYPGTYTEQVVITYAGPLTIYGYTTDSSSYHNNQVIIQDNLNAQDNGGDDPCGTVRARSNDFRMYNIIVKNTYGVGKQATALSAHGTRQGYYGCSFYGYQDTLLADGPGYYQYYSNCYIEGATDFIYGGASVWFGECTIAASAPGFITANSRATTTDPSYYVIDHSTITTDPSATASMTGKVYLGRPWGEYARVVYQNSVLPDIIAPTGWTTLANPAFPVFMEFGNTGAGSSTSKRVNETALSAAISKSAVLGSNWNTWTDNTY